MPVNRIARVASSSVVDFPAVRENSVPLAYDETYDNLIIKNTDGTVKRILLAPDANALFSAMAIQPNIDSENLIRYEYGTITNAEIKALRATPKTLVAAVSGGKMIELISALFFLDYGSNVLTESADNMEIYYSDGTTAAASATIEATNFIDAAADTMYHVYGKTLGILAKTVIDGKGLILKNTGDGEYAGNAGADTVIRYKCVYRIHSCGW